jgi:hypothetical protein
MDGYYPHIGFHKKLAHLCFPAFIPVVKNGAKEHLARKDA